MRRLVPLVLLLALTACGGAGGSSSASCADVIEYAGNTYEGRPLSATPPPTTGRHEHGIRPACDDGGGAPAPAEQVDVEEIAGVPMSEQVALDGQVFVWLAEGPVRDDTQLDPR